MNEFFKYLIPQLLEYFNDDKKVLELFLPNVIKENCEDSISKLRKGKELLWKEN